MGNINNNSLHEWWGRFVGFVGDHNPTPLHPHMIIFIIACLAAVGGCWWVFTTYIRSPKAPGGGGN